MTVRRRLLLASLVTLAVGLGALVVVGNVLLDARVGSERTSLLEADAQAQIAALDVTAGGVRIRETANDSTLDHGAWVLDGSRVIERPRSVRADVDRLAVELGRARRSTQQKGPDDAYLLARPVSAPGSRRPIGAVVVARSNSGVETLQGEVLIGSLAVALLVLLAGAVAIRGALNGALRPVAQMTERAEDWSAHDLDRRFLLGPPRDEITALAATLDHMLARIAASRRHEQRFASEVAHELRTPIAGLRGRAELALGATGEGAEAERAAALESVIAQVDRVEAAVDTLLAEARRELEGSTESADVATLVKEFDGVDLVVPDDLPPAEGEPELIRRMLAPLVDNARAHARERVAIEVEATTETVLISVCDDGDGVDPKDAAGIFEPGARGGDASAGGAGLGLPLARRLARTCGGDVVAVPGATGRFVLSLPLAR